MSDARSSLRQVSHPQQIYLGRLSILTRGAPRWLDIGCGRSLVAPWLPERDRIEEELVSGVTSLVGIDPDLEALRQNHRVPHRVLANAVALPFRSGSFDLVSSNMVFEHLEDPISVLREIHRLLTPGGRLLIHTPNLLDLVTVIAWLVPNRWHRPLVSRFEGRAPADVYPTRFRFNRPPAIRRKLRALGFQEVTVSLLEHPDGLGHVPLLGGLEQTWHRLARRFEALRSTLLIDAVA